MLGNTQFSVILSKAEGSRIISQHLINFLFIYCLKLHIVITIKLNQNYLIILHRHALLRMTHRDCMNYKTIIWTIVLSIFSSSVITYVALATPIGPWIGPTLALFSLVFFARLCNNQEAIIYAVAGGSIGGIMATAISFSFPTFYFLDATAFTTLLGDPFSFVSFLALLCCVAGLFGIHLAYQFHHALLEQQQLAFPIGQLVYKIIDSAQSDKTRQLVAGLATGFGYAVLQTKIFFGNYLIAPTVQVWQKTTFLLFSFPALRLDLVIMPMLLSIGFIAGAMITVPLLVGTFAKIFITDPAHSFYFNYLSVADFTFAFCAGIVLSGAFSGIARFPKDCYQVVARWLSDEQTGSKNTVMSLFTQERMVIGLLLIGFLSWCQFSLIAQLYLVAATAVCAYQVTQIAGKIGLALLGRFATFVMIPGLLLFRFDPLQITLIATFVELVSGVSTEVLFGLKTAQLGNADTKKLFWYQLLGIVVASLTVATVFYLLITRFELGSAQLFAQRPQARALLVQAGQFDYYVLVLGLLFGFVLKKCNIHPMLALGGLLMPLSLSLPLIAGGLLSYLVKDKESYEPLCSGVYAANALAMLCKILS